MASLAVADEKKEVKDVLFAYDSEHIDLLGIQTIAFIFPILVYVQCRPRKTLEVFRQVL